MVMVDELQVFVVELNVLSALLIHHASLLSDTGPASNSGCGPPARGAYSGGSSGDWLPNWGNWIRFHSRFRWMVHMLFGGMDER